MLTNLLFELLRCPGNLMSGVSFAFFRKEKTVDLTDGVSFVNIAGQKEAFRF